MICLPHSTRGRCDVVIGGITQGPSSSTGLAGFATSIGAISAYPYNNTVDVPGGVLSVAAQGVGPTLATATASAALIAAAQDAGPINVFTFSGGAQAFNASLAQLPASITKRINNVTYIDPGMIGGLTYGNGATSVLKGSGSLNSLVSLFGTTGAITVVGTNCNHDANCEVAASASLLDSLSGTLCYTPSTFMLEPTSSNYWVNLFSSWMSLNIADVNSTISYGGYVSGGGGGGELVTDTIAYDLGDVVE